MFALDLVNNSQVFGPHTSLQSLAVMSKEFVKWLLIANLFAWPIAYLIIRNWLEGFAYRIDTGIGIFLLSVMLALSFALRTVIFQTLQASYAPPVTVLKQE